MSRFFYLVFFLLSHYFDCSTLPWWWVVLQPNTAHGHSIGIGSKPVNAPRNGDIFSHWLREWRSPFWRKSTITQTLSSSIWKISAAVTLFTEMNETALDETHGAKLKKNLPVGGLWVSWATWRYFFSGLRYILFLTYSLGWICIYYSVFTLVAVLLYWISMASY